ncbi:MAG: DNA replication/repair protein RecF [Chlorobiales bacterium]|nr:DNA replication/repair protein RecF [Chlorobiales bacterium]
MNIKKLRLTNFRNYSQAEFRFTDPVNIFLGDNGQGKTNILEAIHIISTTKSFRGAKYEHVLKHGEKDFNLESEIYKNNVFKKVMLNYRNDSRIFSINEKKINKVSEMLGTINVSILCPEDILIIKGDSQYRRKFIDIALSQLDGIYLANLINYHKVLKNKNSVLKLIKLGKSKISELDPWNYQIIELFKQIFTKRRDFFNILNKENEKISNILSGNKETIVLKYLDSVFQGANNDPEEFEKELKIKQKRVLDEEIRRGISLVGPHRDDFSIDINGRNLRQVGSQGQQRTAAISLRLAEIEYMNSVLREFPILLIDDIFSELDDKRKSYFMELLDHDTQMFLTGTRKEEFPKIINRAQVFNIAEGKADYYGK